MCSSDLFQGLAEGQQATFTVAYDIQDEHGAYANTHKFVNITVNGANDAPVAGANQSVTVTEDDAPVSVNLLAGASDVDHGAVLHAVNVGPASPGVTIVGDTLTLDPNAAAFQGLAAGQQATFTVAYDIQDEHGAYANTHKFVNITVNGANDAPIAGTPVVVTRNEGDRKSTRLNSSH